MSSSVASYVSGDAPPVAADNVIVLIVVPSMQENAKRSLERRPDGDGQRNEMDKLEHRMTLRLGGVIAVGVAIIVAFDKLF